MKFQEKRVYKQYQMKILTRKRCTIKDETILLKNVKDLMKLMNTFVIFSLIFMKIHL